MNFSILVPTRSRPDMLKKLIESIIERTHDLSGVEFLFRVDDDDVSSDYQLIIPDAIKNRCNFRLLVDKRTHSLSRDYYNVMALQAEGDFIWALNDDCVLFGPHDWDKMILKEASKLRGKIAYINIGVSGHTDTYSPFPMLSAETILTLGYFHHPKLNNWGQDEVAWNIFASLKAWHGHDRMIDLREKMTIIHLNQCGDIGDENQQHMRDSMHLDGGINAGAFNTFGYYNEPIAQLKEAIENGL